MKNPVPAAALLALLLLAVAAGILSAQARAAAPFENATPEDAWVFITVRNLPTLTEKFKAHSLYVLWNEPSVQHFLAKARDHINQKLHAAEGKAGVTLAEAKKLFTGQIALFITPSPDDEDPRVVLMADVGQNGARAMHIAATAILAAQENGVHNLKSVEENMNGARIISLFDAAAQAEKPELVYALAGDVFLLGNALDTVRQTVAFLHNPPPTSLASLNAYKHALTRISPSADIIAFVNLERLIQQVAEKDQTGRATEIITGLGLDAAIAASFGLSVTTQDACNRIFLNVGQPRGLLKIIMPEPGPLHTPRDAPADTAGFIACRFDPAHAYDELEKILQAVAPEALAMLNMKIQQHTQTTGEPFDLRNDVLAVFGPRWTFYSRFQKPLDPRTSQQIILMADIPGKAAFDRVIAKLRRVAPPFAALQPEDYLGHQVYSIASPQPPGVPPPPPGRPIPAFTATENRLIIANTVQAIKAHLRHLNSRAPSLADRTQYRQGLRALPADGAIMISFSDPAFQVELLLNSLRHGALDPFLQKMQNDPPKKELLDLFDFSQLPPNEDVLKHLVTSAGCIVVKPDGLLFITRSPAHP